MVHEAFQILASLLEGRLPPDKPSTAVKSYTHLPPDAVVEQAMDHGQNLIDAIFERRMAGLYEWKKDALDDDPPEIRMEILETVLLAVFTGLLPVTIGAMAIRVAGFIGSTIEREVLKAAVDQVIAVGQEVAATKAEVAKAQDEGDEKQLVHQLFKMQEEALTYTKLHMKQIFNNTGRKIYDAAGSQLKANSDFDRMCIQLYELVDTGFDYQYFSAVSAYAAAMAQNKLGLFDPASWEYSSSDVRRGTDVFTIGRDPNTTGPVELARYARGVIFFRDGNSPILIDPVTHEPRLDPALGPTIKPGRYGLVEQPSLGRLPKGILLRLRTRPLSEWHLPMTVFTSGYVIRVNELDEVRIEDQNYPHSLFKPHRWDRTASIHFYESIGKPLLDKYKL